MSPLQGLSNEHLLLIDNRVALSARVEEVIAFKGVYIEVDLYFVTLMTIEEIELKILIKAVYIKVAVVLVVVCQSLKESKQAKAVKGKRTEVEKVLILKKDLELQSSYNKDETI
jgi:hypothetical protein